MASDQDTTPFMFALVGEDINEMTGVFEIDTETGEITTMASLDYEQIRELPNLFLIVFDAGFLNSNATFRIEILDENDNTPIFSPSIVERSVSESASIGSEVFIAMATDADDTTNAQLIYSLAMSEDFAINSVSGAITVNEELDFEAQENYVLEVVATDRGQPARNGTMILNITIVDQNDNAPVITNPLPTYTVRENVDTGFLVGSVNAMDVDSGINSELRFEITAGNMANRFFIDSEAGDIYTNATIDREEQSAYSLTVEVSTHLLT